MVHHSISLLPTVTDGMSHQGNAVGRIAHNFSRIKLGVNLVASTVKDLLLWHESLSRVSLSVPYHTTPHQ